MVWTVIILLVNNADGIFKYLVATYFAFKYVFRRKAVQLERTNLNYAALATITREGGFLVCYQSIAIVENWETLQDKLTYEQIVFIVRLSAIPSHFTTAVFATCGVAFWIFLVATFFTLPKQLVSKLYLLFLNFTPAHRISAHRPILSIWKHNIP